MRSNELYLRISPNMFHYLKFILEGYDNLAILSSEDMSRGVVKLRYSPHSTRDIIQLLSSIASRLA